MEDVSWLLYCPVVFDNSIYLLTYSFASQLLQFTLPWWRPEHPIAEFANFSLYAFIVQTRLLFEVVEARARVCRLLVSIQCKILNVQYSLISSYSLFPGHCDSATTELLFVCRISSIDNLPWLNVIAANPV